MSSKPPAPAAAAAAPCRAGEALGTEAEGLEFRLGPEASLSTAAAATGAEAFETAEARLALGVDLAAIEGLALVVLAQDLVRGIDLGKARRRFGIVFVGVGMQFLGEATEGAFDVACARLPIDAQHLIGITRPHGLHLFFGAGPARRSYSI